MTCISVVFVYLFVYFRYISSSTALQFLDISGAIRLGNDGSLKILRACCGCGMFTREDGVTGRRVCLRGCGMESPLPGELVELLRSVLKDGQMVQ